MRKDGLGDRMKRYESLYDTKMMDYLPVIARIDGKCFHTFTKNCKKPFDENLHRSLVYAMKVIMTETSATFGYTQSDEISIVWVQKELESEISYSARINKFNSVLASMATAYFNESCTQPRLAFFDCRTWQAPNKIEVANYFLWRENDAGRNSIQMIAQSLYSHKQLHKKNSKDLQEMIFQKGINWNNLPNWQKRGSYCCGTNGELDNLFLKKCLNRVEVIFEAKDAIYENSSNGAQTTEIV